VLCEAVHLKRVPYGLVVVESLKHPLHVLRVITHADVLDGLLERVHAQVRRAVATQIATEGICQTNHCKLVLHVVQQVRHLSEAPVMPQQVLEVPVLLKASAQDLIITNKLRVGHLTCASSDSSACQSGQETILIRCLKVAASVQAQAEVLSGHPALSLCVHPTKCRTDRILAATAELRNGLEGCQQIARVDIQANRRVTSSLGQMQISGAIHAI
jgi:hypothetical protein